MNKSCVVERSPFNSKTSYYVWENNTDVVWKQVELNPLGSITLSDTASIVTIHLSLKTLE
ncbi:MAG: hypothetical protein LBU29_00050 [Endomicrobium sp.]|jgi:hypothetical protein|nr:hypothetical protein [Endomicrobium sp.]